MASNDDTPAPGTDRQWWLYEGPETCLLCESKIHPESITYCVSCDQGVCLACYRSPEGDGFICRHCEEDEKQPTGGGESA